MMLAFRTATRVSDTISLCASIACCSVLILMRFKPPKSIGNYRYCYYILSSFECVSAISHFFGAPVARNALGLQTFYVNGDTYLAFSAHGCLSAQKFWILAFHAFELWLLTCFIYRYATVCRNYYILDMLSTTQSFAVGFAVITFNHLFATFTFYLMFFPSQALRDKAERLLARYFDISQFSCIAEAMVGFNYDIGPVYISSAAVQYICAIGNVITVSSLVTIVACALHIFNYIKVNSFSAMQTSAMQHYRVLLYLALQAFIPFCFVYSLALICQLVIIIRVDISFLAPIFTITTSIPPLIGAISVIGLTNEYRKMFAKAIGLKRFGATTSTTALRNGLDLPTVSRSSSTPRS